MSDINFASFGRNYLERLEWASRHIPLQAVEELAKVDPSISTVCDVHNTLVYIGLVNPRYADYSYNKKVNTMLKDHGTDAQKEKYLGPLATTTLGSFCLSEGLALCSYYIAGSGSDAFALQTKAVKDGNK